MAQGDGGSSATRLGAAAIATFSSASILWSTTICKHPDNDTGRVMALLHETSEEKRSFSRRPIFYILIGMIVAWVIWFLYNVPVHDGEKEPPVKPSPQITSTG